MSKDGLEFGEKRKHAPRSISWRRGNEVASRDRSRHVLGDRHARCFNVGRVLQTSSEWPVGLRPSQSTTSTHLADSLELAIETHGSQHNASHASCPMKSVLSPQLAPSDSPARRHARGLCSAQLGRGRRDGAREGEGEGEEEGAVCERVVLRRAESGDAAGAGECSSSQTSRSWTLTTEVCLMRAAGLCEEAKWTGGTTNEGKG